MKYTVVWRPSAERKLAEIWVNALSGGDITNATDTIDAMLSRQPLDVGESRSGKSRILIVPPLCVYYDVHESDRLVAVWAVWQRAESR